MGDYAGVCGADIVEGEPLTGDQLAAVIAWRDTRRSPLLRMHPACRDGSERAEILTWATQTLASGRRLAIMRRDQLTAR